MGSWASRIPALRDGLQLSHSMLSIVLLCGGLGAVISYPFAMRMMAKFGDRKTTLYAGLGLCSVLIAIGAAPSTLLLMLAVLFLGITCGCFGVGLNSVASHYEKQAGQSKMAMLHAMGCAGSLGGALLSSVVAGAHMKPLAHFLILTMPVSFLFWFCFQLIGTSSTTRPIEKKAFALPSRPLLMLGILGFCGAMAENSIVDWASVFMKDHFGVSEGFAPLALSAFTVAMLISRLTGDQLKEKYGARRPLTAGGLLAAAGMVFAIFAPNAYWALAGFACAGMGLSLLFPFVLSVAGKQGVMAAASVGTMTNIGALMGPPVIGTLADYLGMQAALAFIALLSLVIGTVAATSTVLD